MKKLIKFGGTPFQPNAKGVIPAVEATLAGSPQIFEYILSQEGVDLSITDVYGRNLALAGALSGHPKKIEALRAAGASFPKKLLKEGERELRDKIIHYFAFQDFKSSD